MPRVIESQVMVLLGGMLPVYLDCRCGTEVSWYADAKSKSFGDLDTRGLWDSHTSRAMMRNEMQLIGKSSTHA